MSYAKVAKENNPPDPMPEPSQKLRDGLNNEVPGTASVLVSDTKAEIDIAQVEAEKSWDETKDKLEDAAESAGKTANRAADAAGKTLDNAANEAGKAINRAADEAGKKVNRAADAAEKKARELKKRAKEELDEAETAATAAWAKAKDVLLRPGTLGGLMGVVNVGLLGSMTYWAVKNRDVKWDRRNVSAAIVGTLALFGVEAYITDTYLDTPEGKAEAERAKREGSRLYLKAKEVILRPNVAGGLVGILNIGVLGTIGYFAYRDWDKRWDHQVVVGVTVGLLALSGIEGYFGTKYVEDHPKK
ncbi:hypothetical protein CspeluHIS016_0112290 [Cutaneotrichosporon spelunceum]|uniref:Mitochondrial outer membrane protein OM14 C-terminal domain-containing protein n=1 Tax=Cutaneotrichosporon spelunceum TaxID=1672016 RepID=A0AAD3TPJ1_9TREE|nr:hypothetical protein CspeluHIS016_0112290 [Cutaneotrichosporon spelunceum]